MWLGYPNLGLTLQMDGSSNRRPTRDRFVHVNQIYSREPPVSSQRNSWISALCVSARVSFVHKPSVNRVNLLSMHLHLSIYIYLYLSVYLCISIISG